MPMATYMTDTGRMTRRMASASTHIQTAPNMKVIGSTIGSMVKVKSIGLMVPSMKDSTNMEKKTVMVSFCGLTALAMVATS